MAKVREQFMVGIAFAREMFWDASNNLCFKETFYDDKERRSCKVPVSECRIFRKESKTFEDKVTIVKDEFGRISRDADGIVELDWTAIRSAREFVVVDFKKCKQTMKIKKALKHGITMMYADGTTAVFKRVSRSAAKSRTSKALFTCKDVHEVRDRCSFGAKFDDEEVISKMEARFGLIESSSIEIKRVPTIDVLPDFEITRKHDVEMYDVESEQLNLLTNFEKDYNPLDGQGTILPAYAVEVTHELEVISAKDRDYMIRKLKKQPDPRVLVATDEKFARMWARVPQAFLIRFGFAKGLLAVYPHNIESTDCNGETVRTSGKVMKFWNEDAHMYNFNADIMFTDSMWKANFDKAYLTNAVNVYDADGVLVEDNRAKLEVVMWAKQPKGMIYMGYQYWQALNKDLINPSAYAKAKIDELKDTIFTNADDAKAFLGNIDMTLDPDGYEDSMTKAGGRIQKVLEILNENPDMIRETYIQRALREMRERYIEDMANGRIPVSGANPFVITAPELTFGHASELQAGESYYNGGVKSYAAFRSPLIHRSEATRLHTVEVSAYTGLYKDLIVLSPFDDTLPRMGGADTDGDRLAITDDEGVVNAVHDEMPMLYDAGADAEKQKVCDDAIYEFDYKTIVSDAPTIGEVTNMSTTWKDLAQNPKIMHAMGMDEDTIDYIVKVLRFMQGWAIDYAKTGYFPSVPAMVQTSMSPDWHPWSKGAVEAGIDGAEVYESASQLGKLSRSVKRYLEQKYYKAVEQSANTRDFTFELSSAANLEDLDRIKPIVATLERSYRNDLQRMHDVDLDEDETRDLMNSIVDKYQRAVMSIDADIATIAAACYQFSYYENGTKGKSISFPWVVAYEGILLNASASNDEKTKLRVSRFTGHIDDVPSTLKFYRCESKGEGYSVKSRVPNGTYETFRKNGNLYIKTKVRANARLKKVEAARPADMHIPFDMVGFKANGYSASEVLSALKANDGIISVRKHHDGDNGELRAAVFIGEQRMGSVAKQHKGLLAAHLPCELHVTNVDKLEASYINKDQKKVQAAFYALDTTFIGGVEVEAEEAPAIDASAYMGYDDMYDVAMDAPSYPVFREDIMEAISHAPYYAFEIDPKAINIVGVAVKQTGAIKQGTKCAEVVLTNARGQKKVVEIVVVPGKQFGVADGTELPEVAINYVLQIAHHELYRAHIERQAQ